MAGMELRPYQSEAKAAVFEQWETVNRTLLVLPTGCGKTIVFAKVADLENAPGPSGIRPIYNDVPHQ